MKILQTLKIWIKLTSTTFCKKGLRKNMSLWFKIFNNLIKESIIKVQKNSLLIFRKSSKATLKLNKTIFQNNKFRLMTLSILIQCLLLNQCKEMLSSLTFLRAVKYQKNKLINQRTKRRWQQRCINCKDKKLNKKLMMMLIYPKSI